MDRVKAFDVLKKIELAIKPKDRNKEPGLIDYLLELDRQIKLEKEVKARESTPESSANELEVSTIDITPGSDTSEDNRAD